MKLRDILLSAGAALSISVCAAMAGPWAEVGDTDLRSDILILASAGVIDDATMQWPLPWTGILRRLSQSNGLDGQPDYVREAARRVQTRGMAEVRTKRLMPSLSLDAASKPALVRDFGAMGRGTLESKLAVTALWDTTAFNVSLGTHTLGYGDHQALILDDSYVAQRVGNAVITLGYKTHWWGPGWISALSLSNNARPMPQIGISRLDTKPFESPWLSWIGPWQAEFFVGLLDGPRAAKNTGYIGFRFGFSPLPHLEIGFSRTTMLCGSGHECKPVKDYFDILNDPNNPNQSNDQGDIDIRYSYAFQDVAFETYVQFMNEDTNPFHHSGSSHLYGASAWTPLWDGTGRLTVEYADTVPTLDLWGSGTMHGFAYNNGNYVDGMRYRGRTLGFSLDSDSHLMSMQVNYRRNAGDSYTLSFHHAEISTGQNTSTGCYYVNAYGNSVTTEPVTINLVEGRVSMPFDVDPGIINVALAGRVQDDRPRPDRGWTASVELSVGIAF
jgi:hypothetical protein